MWDLAPWLGIKPWLPALGARGLSHCGSCIGKCILYHWSTWEAHSLTLTCHKMHHFEVHNSMFFSILTGDVRSMWPCSHMAFPLNVCGERQRKQKDLWYLFCLQGHQSDQVRIPSLWPHLSLTASLKALSPNTITLGCRAPTYTFVKDTIHP